MRRMHRGPVLVTLRVTRFPHAEREEHTLRLTRHKGFSLLEIILALAILVGGLAVLGEAARLGMRNARLARDTTRAHLLCESTLNEIAAGSLPAEPVQDVPLEIVFDPKDPGWVYSVEVESLEDQGLVTVRVTVRQNLPPEKQPLSVSLVRWMIDATATTSTTGTTESTQ